MHGEWREIGDRVWIGRYRFLDQTIGVVGSDGELGVIDTRASARHARELLDDVRALGAGEIALAIDTHMHWDHAFGNATFRPVPIWGHARCASGILETGEAQRATLLEEMPEDAADWEAVVLDPPDRTFDESAYVQVGGRRIELRHLGRGHTDNDVVVLVPDVGLTFAGDLLENGGAPSFGDSFPLDWPETASRVVELMREVVVPGHGEPGDRRFAEDQVGAFLAIAERARQVHRGEASLDEAARDGPFPTDVMVEAIGRGVAQLRGELDRAAASAPG